MDFLTDEVMTKIKRIPAVAEKDLEALHDLSIEVSSMMSLMEAVGQPNEIRSTMLYHRLLSKLPVPTSVLLSWGITALPTTQNCCVWRYKGHVPSSPHLRGRRTTPAVACSAVKRRFTSLNGTFNTCGGE